MQELEDRIVECICELSGSGSTQFTKEEQKLVKQRINRVLSRVTPNLTSRYTATEVIIALQVQLDIIAIALNQSENA